MKIIVQSLIMIGDWCQTSTCYFRGLRDNAVETISFGWFPHNFLCVTTLYRALAIPVASLTNLTLKQLDNFEKKNDFSF